MDRWPSENRWITLDASGNGPAALEVTWRRLCSAVDSGQAEMIATHDTPWQLEAELKWGRDWNQLYNFYLSRSLMLKLLDSPQYGFVEEALWRHCSKGGSQSWAADGDGQDRGQTSQRMQSHEMVEPNSVLFGHQAIVPSTRPRIAADGEQLYKRGWCSGGSRPSIMRRTTQGGGGSILKCYSNLNIVLTTVNI